MATAIICLVPLSWQGSKAIRSYRKRLTTGCCEVPGEAGEEK